MKHELSLIQRYRLAKLFLEKNPNWYKFENDRFRRYFLVKNGLPPILGKKKTRKKIKTENRNYRNKIKIEKQIYIESLRLRGLYNNLFDFWNPIRQNLDYMGTFRKTLCVDQITKE